MVVDNFKKSFTGLSKYTHDDIPIPVGGDEGSGTIFSDSANAWRTYNNNYGTPHQYPFCYFNHLNWFYVTYGYGQSITQYIGNTGGYQMWFVDVGFGFDTEDKSDTKLKISNWLDSNKLSHKYGQVKCPTPDANGIVHVESVYENTGSSDVMVTEIGLICRTPNAAGNAACYTNAKFCNFLVARKLLQDPVVIHPGEVYKFVYKLKA